jgi:hypothetical protein
MNLPIGMAMPETVESLNWQRISKKAKFLSLAEFTIDHRLSTIGYCLIFALNDVTTKCKRQKVKVKM